MTTDVDVLQTNQKVKAHGSLNDYIHEELGMNSRLEPFRLRYCGVAPRR